MNAELFCVTRPRLLAPLPALLALTLPTHPASAQEVGQRFRDCPTCPVMVVVPTGSFLMGSPPESEEAYEDERPQHFVTIESPFAVRVDEVTFAEWDACVNAGCCQGHSPDDMGWGRGRIPVTTVSWDDAWEYTAWLSEVTGEAYRLLSEAEWEYVARAGTRTERYWGDDASEQCWYANGDDEAVSCSDGYEYGRQLARFRPTRSGSMTFWAISGSGRRAVGTATTLARRPMAAAGVWEIVPSVYNAAARWEVARQSSARRYGWGNLPRSGMGGTGSAWPEP